MTTEYIVMISTAGSKEEADKLANALVSSEKAACVQMLPIESCYAWEGKVNSDPEILLLIKTRADLFQAASDVIKQNHSYSVPEIISLPVLSGSNEYLAWINSVTNHKS